MKLGDKVKVNVSQDVLLDEIDKNIPYELSKIFKDGECGLAPWREDNFAYKIGYYAWIVNKTDIEIWGN